MINVAICDDEKIWLNIASMYVRSYKKHQLELFKFSEGLELYDSIREREYHMIFMDVKLYDTTSFKLVDRVKERYPLCLIVYISNYDDYYIDMVHHEPFRFLHKPISESEVHKVLDSGIKRLTKKDDKYQFIYNRATKVIDLNDVEYFSSNYRTCCVTMKDNTEYEFYENIENVFDEIQKYPYFSRISKGVIVNLYEIDMFNLSEVCMCNGQTFLLSRLYRKKVQNKYSEYMYKYINE